MSDDTPDICQRLTDACVGWPNATISWPHRLLHDANAEISALRKRVEAAEALDDAAMRYVSFVADHNETGEVVPLHTEPVMALQRARAAYRATAISDDKAGGA